MSVWPSGQHSWLQIMGSRVRISIFPNLNTVEWDGKHQLIHPQHAKQSVKCCFSPATTMTFEPAHEIMVLSVHELILQTRMRSHPVGLDVWFFAGPFICFHTSCVRTAKALARLHGCAGSPEPSLVAYVIKYHNLMSWLIYIMILLYKR